MSSTSPNWPYYLPKPWRRVVVIVLIIVLGGTTIAYAMGHGAEAVAAVVIAAVSAATTQGVRALLRARPRRA